MNVWYHAFDQVKCEFDTCTTNKYFVDDLITYDLLELEAFCQTEGDLTYFRLNFTFCHYRIVYTYGEQYISCKQFKILHSSTNNVQCRVRNSRYRIAFCNAIEAQ